MKTTIVVVRHGLVEGISPERFRGWHDVPLTPEGERQALATAGRIHAKYAPDAVYCSPLKRTRQTAEAIGDAVGLTPAPLKSLIDINTGEYTWKTPDEVGAIDPLWLERWHEAPELVRFPKGESVLDVAARAGKAIRKSLRRHHGGTVLLVTHDSVIRVMLVALLGVAFSAYQTLAVEPCAINEFTIEEAKVRIVRFGETAY